MNNRQIILRKVNVHNLKSVDLTLDTNQLIVFCGVSGSGKSSLAFDTLYVEGQRRYVDSLSTFARRQMGDMAKPDLEHAEGISPTISIEQKTAGRNPRSTVGTMTEIYDYLRVLYARVGVPHCPVSGEPVSPQSRERIIRLVQSMPAGSKIIVLAPYARNKKAEFKEDFQDLLRKGFMRLRIDGDILNIGESIALDGSVAHDVDIVIDRIKVDDESQSRIAEAITQALGVANGVCSVLDSESGNEQLFSMHAYSPASGLSYEALEPHDFSFNSPSGMCPACNGLGEVKDFDVEKVIDPDLSIAQDCCSVGSSYQTVRYGNIYDNLARLYRFDVNTPWKKLTANAQKVFLYGNKKKYTRMNFVHPETGATWSDYVAWKGVLNEAQQRFREATSDVYRNKMQKLMTIQPCPECEGTRLKAYPAATLLGGKRITDITNMTVEECFNFFERLKLSVSDQTIAEELVKEIQQRLRFLLDVGLHYLSLSRTAPTLSGGEAQRVRLASQIGCGLVGVTYILDEPSIGLHPRDNKKLIQTLKHLRDKGNTVIVVEHDEETMWEADHIVDFGPGAGTRGGNIMCSGSLKDLVKCKESITSDYLTGRRKIPVPKKRRKGNGSEISITGACHHNLKDVTVKIPLGRFVAITGVSGSGKSSLISDTLFPALDNVLHKAELEVGKHKAIEGLDAIDKVIAIDQTPIGRNPRSNPATYIKLFDEIRDLFSQLPESRARGYLPGRFSFNVKEGTCPRCIGMGMVKIDMDFLDDAWIECPVCKGRRFDHETLSVLFKGKNIYDILEMDVAEALEHFENLPSIKHKLETLQKVGMEYIKLGQSSTTLSGGEAQRIKLAKELVRPATGRTLYILDEPTTGLHFYDIQHLLNVLHELVERGNTVVVIEHNMDVVKTADWIIDLGPEGGAGGGEIVAKGTPETIAKQKSPTGVALRAVLDHDPEALVAELMKSRKVKKRDKVTDEIDVLSVRGAEQNNLKHLDVDIPREKITVCTGPSGSGKTSLAFETIYAEGQRRYIESLSPYARQFVKQMPKPKVGQVEGLSPAIAIEQKSHAGNPRSTVGTMTEIYDYLRVLFARVGTPHCPETGEVIKAISKDHVVDRVLSYPEGEKIHILAPIAIKKSESFESVINRLKRQGYLRVRFNGELYNLEDETVAIPYDRKRKAVLFLVVDRLKVEPCIKARIFEAIENAAKIGEGQLTILREDGQEVYFNLTFSVESTGKSYPEITPHTFSFNTLEGMCPECQGLGVNYGANLSQQPLLMSASVGNLIRLICKNYMTNDAFKVITAMLSLKGIPAWMSIARLKPDQLAFLLNGDPLTTHPMGKNVTLSWVGINNVLVKAAKSAGSEVKDIIMPLLDQLPCPACSGSRINPLARHVTIDNHNIANVCEWPIERSLPFVEELPLPSTERKFLDEVKKQLTDRLQFLNNVGLGYLALNRTAPTLSGGEAQRIRLARQLGSGLTGVLYVLDEPTIGLHPRDNERLNEALAHLRDLGNTILMVEHDPLTIAKADYVLDFGPQSGRHGGHITAKGTYKQILRDPDSLTGAYLSGKKSVSVPEKYRKPGKGSLEVMDACKHNLQNVSVSLPLGTMICITGVSGSGKSTLVHHILEPALERGIGQRDIVVIDGATIKGINQIDKVIAINQDPIGRTSRSDVTTYVDVLTPIREFFASLPEARRRGLQPKHFSYNHRKGMCTACWGLGYRKVEMHFLPPVKVVCEECQGMRLNPLSLEVEYKGKTLGQYLQSTVEEVRNTFENHPKIVRILDTLISVGLDYLTLGQEMATLSGGEAQRIKLSRDLAKRPKGHTIYLLDEPTTGLHSDDTQKLLGVLHRLVDKGNTIVFIEHNIDMIRNADYVIDLGPGAGDKGGKVVVAGTPHDVAKCKASATGKFL
ncbi:MAG: excinuclease ABC subunit UvrA [Chlamydiales bacterium]|nr:excinuclease ABC subunit UvrA [Chlamydiales bacterium]